APPHRRVEDTRHLGRLDEELTAPPGAVHIGGHQPPLGALSRTALEHEDGAVLEHDLSFHLAIAGRADRDRGVVEEIGTQAISHGEPPSRAVARAARNTQWRRGTPTEWPKGRRRAHPA